MTIALDRKVWLKWVGAAFLALSLAYAAKIATELSNDVHLTYTAPATQLRVTLYDDEGTRLRRAEFEGGVFKHMVVLPNGTYRAELTPRGLPTYRHEFTVDGDIAIEVVYQPRRP